MRRPEMMPKQRHILLPYLVVSLLLLIGALVFLYDSRTIIEAEEDEEENGRILLYSERYVSGLQHTQIQQHHFLMSGKESFVVDFNWEKQATIKRLEQLREALGSHYPDSVPKIDAVENIQARYFSELDRVIANYADGNSSRLSQVADSDRSSVHLRQIQLLLEQLAADVFEKRTRINEDVMFSIRRAGISVALMAAVLVGILAFGYRLTSRALAANEDLAERLRHEATHDPLTRLPNRRYFMDWIHRAIAMADRTGHSVAVCFIDLDGFKPINDHHGHDAGDAALKAVAERFQALMRESDVVVRLGGDEFAVLVPQAPGDDQLSALARRIVASLETPVAVGDARIKLGASLGVAVYPRDADDVDGLICAADAAMYRAKDGGKNRHLFFERTA